MPGSPFLFITCQVGAEPTLKKEIARLAPELRFAYSRPGFLTFKHSEGAALDPGFALDSIFARAYGISLGKTAPDPAKVVAMANDAGLAGPMRLHFWTRDLHPHSKMPPGYVPGELSEATASQYAELRKDPLFHKDPVASVGDLVLDVVVVEENEWWIGCHRHGEKHSPHPGGRARIELPAESPSRAYLKLEEGVRWSGAPMQKGDTAVEIGSSPGGATYALLRRGLRVVGIDPREMDPRVLKIRNFTWIQKPVAKVKREELPEKIEWLLLDMNVAPNISIFAVDRLASRMKDSLVGVLLTVKLTSWSFADEIPHMMEHLRAMGMVDVRARQLAYNGQEFLFYGLTLRGHDRLSGLP